MLARDNYFHQHAAQRGRNQPHMNVGEENEYQQDDDENRGIYQQQNGYIDETQQINEQSQEDDGEWQKQQQDYEIGSNSDLPYEQKMLNKQLNDAVQSMRYDDDILPALEQMTHLVLKAKEFLEEEKYNYMFETIIKVLNKDAVEALNENNWQKCSQILNVCDDLTQPHKYGFFVEMRSLSLNNQGCMYKRMNEYQMALNCFEKALHLQIQQNSKVYFGYTHLNISAILNQTGEQNNFIFQSQNQAKINFQSIFYVQRHQQALSHAKKAVIQLHKDYLEYQKQGQDIQALKQLDSYVEICNNLALAFYNVAVEEEYFNNTEMATLNYENALTFSEDNLGKTHHMTIKFRETLHEFLAKLSDGVQSQRGNGNKISMRPKPPNKQARPMSAPRKGQQALDQIQQIEKKISTIKDAYNLKGSDFEFRGNQVRLRSASRKQTNQSNNNQNIKICVPKKRSSPSADKQQKMIQQPQLLSSQQIQSLQQGLQKQQQGSHNYDKYLVDTNGTRGAITASIRFHRTPDQNGGRNFKISQRGQPVSTNHNSSNGYFDNSSNTLQPLTEFQQHHILQNRNNENAKLRPTSANQGNHRIIKRDRSNDNQSYQNNTSYTQGNITYDNSYNNTSLNHYPHVQTSLDQPLSGGQRYPFQYPVLKRNNQQNDQQAINNGRSFQNNTSSSFNQGTNSSFQNNSSRRINNNNSFNNKDNTSIERRSNQNAYSERVQSSQSQRQSYPQQNNNYMRQSPNKMKRGVTFSEEEEETETRQYNNRQIQNIQRNNYLNSSGPNHQNNLEYSYNHGNNSTNVSHSLNNQNNNTQIYNNTNNSFRNSLPPPHPHHNVKQNNSGQNSRKHYDDFQPVYNDENDQNNQEEEVNEIIHEEDENNYPRSASAAAQQIQENVVDNYELDWEEDYNEEPTQNPQIKKNQNEFLNTLKQHQEQDKSAIDSDIQRKKREQEDLQKRIEQLKQIEKQEQQKLSDQEKVKEQQLIEIKEKESQLNKRIQELIQTENEEKQKYAKLKEQEEKERLQRLQELENISKQAEEQKQKLEEIKVKELDSQNNLGKSQKIGSEEQFPFSASDRQSSSRRILIKKQSGLNLNSTQYQPDNELTEEYLNIQLRANSNYLILREFSEKDINLIDTEKNSIQLSARMSLTSTRRGLLAAVFELNLQMLIIIYVDNQIRLQSSQSTYPQITSSSSSLRRKNDQWQHSMDWSDCSALLEQISIDDLKTLLLNLFENEIEPHLKVNLKERYITLTNQISLQIIQNLSPILLKVSLKKNLKSSIVEIDNSASGLIENSTSSLLTHVDKKDILEQYKEKTFLTNNDKEKSGIFAVYYDRQNKQLVFEFISLLYDEDLTRKAYYHKIDLQQMSDHYYGGDYLSHSQFTKIVKEIFSEYQKVEKYIRVIEEKKQNNYHILKIPFLQKWNYNEVVQDTPKHTIEATFLISQNTQIGQATLVVEETLKEKEKNQLTDEDYDTLIINTKQNLLQTVEERDIIQNYQKAQILSNKSKNKKSKDGILGVYYDRENKGMIIEFVAVRQFDIEDTHTYQHKVDLRLICEHYGENCQYLTSDQVTNVITQIIAQYKLIQSKITIEPYYLKVPFDQDWLYDEVTENEETKIYTFFNFSTRPQGKTIIEKKQTIQSLIPQSKKVNKKTQPKYNKEQEGAAIKIQSHYKRQNTYQNTKSNIQKTKKFIFAKSQDIQKLPYFITLFQNLSNKQYYVQIQSLLSRKNSSKYINFTQQIKQNIQDIIDHPDSFFNYYQLDTNAKLFKFYDKKNESAKKITNFFKGIKKQKSMKKIENNSTLPIKESISPLKKRQSSAQMTQNEIYEDFSSISRAYKSNQRQTDDRDLEISPSIEKQSLNEEYFERQKVRLESSGVKSVQDKNSRSQTPISSGFKQNSIQDNSNKNLKSEFNQQELNNSLNNKSQISKQSPINQSQLQKEHSYNKKEADLDLDNLAFDESFEKAQRDNNSQRSQQKSQQKSDKRQQISNQKYDNQEFDQFEDSIQEQNKIDEDNQYQESAENMRVSQQSMRSGNSKTNDKIQKQEQLNQSIQDSSNIKSKQIQPSESNKSINRKDVSITQQSKRQSESKNFEEIKKQELLDQSRNQYSLQNNQEISQSKQIYDHKLNQQIESKRQSESKTVEDIQKQQYFNELRKESSSKYNQLYPEETPQSKSKGNIQQIEQSESDTKNLSKMLKQSKDFEDFQNSEYNFKQSKESLFKNEQDTPQSIARQNISVTKQNQRSSQSKNIDVIQNQDTSQQLIKDSSIKNSQQVLQKSEEIHHQINIQNFQEALQSKRQSEAQRLSESKTNEEFQKQEQFDEIKKESQFKNTKDTPQSINARQSYQTSQQSDSKRQSQSVQYEERYKHEYQKLLDNSQVSQSDKSPQSVFKQDYQATPQSKRQSESRTNDQIYKQDQSIQFIKESKFKHGQETPQSNQNRQAVQISHSNQSLKQSENKSQEESLKQEQFNQLSQQGSSKNSLQSKPVETPQSNRKSAQSIQKSQRQDESYYDEQKQEYFDEIKQDSQYKSKSEQTPQSINRQNEQKSIQNKSQEKIQTIQSKQDTQKQDQLSQFNNSQFLHPESSQKSIFKQDSQATPQSSSNRLNESKTNEQKNQQYQVDQSRKESSFKNTLHLYPENSPQLIVRQDSFPQQQSSIQNENQSIENSFQDQINKSRNENLSKNTQQTTQSNQNRQSVQISQQNQSKRLSESQADQEIQKQEQFNQQSKQGSSKKSLFQQIEETPQSNKQNVKIALQSNRQSETQFSQINQNQQNIDELRNENSFKKDQETPQSIKRQSVQKDNQTPQSIQRQSIQIAQQNELDRSSQSKRLSQSKHYEEKQNNDNKLDQSRKDNSVYNEQNTPQSVQKLSQSRQSENKILEEIQKQEYFDQLRKESSFKNNSNLYPKEYSQSNIKQAEDLNLNLRQDLVDDISPIPKMLGTTEFYQQQNKEASPQFSINGMSVNEDDIFNQSNVNKYHNQSDQIKEQSQQYELDTVNVYNVIKKGQRTSLQKVSLKSYFDFETNQIVLSCLDIPSIKVVQFSIDISHLKCYDQIAEKSPKQLRNLNREEVINQVQEYIYEHTLIYIVDSTEIVILSDSQLNLIKRIQNKFIHNHYRHKFQMTIDDEFLSTQYTCFVQIGYIKRTLFILILTYNLSNFRGQNECQKKFVKLPNISIRQITKNQQKYIFDHIYFNKKDKHFYFDMNQFEKILQQQQQNLALNIKTNQNNEVNQSHQNVQLNKSAASNKSIQQNKSMEQNKYIEQNKSVDSIQNAQNKKSVNSSSIHQSKVLEYIDNIYNNQIENLEESGIQQHSQQSKKSNANTPMYQDNILEQYYNQINDNIQLIKDYPISYCGNAQKQVYISAYWLKNDNIIELKSSEDNGIVPYRYTLQQTEVDEQELKQQCQQILSRCQINQNKIVYYGQNQEQAATKLKQVLVKEDILKSIDISINNQKKQGTAYFVRKGAIWFIKLYSIMETNNSNEQDNYNNEFIQTDNVEIKQMSKIKKQTIIKHFRQLINSNIEIVNDQIKLLNKQQLLDKIDYQMNQSHQQQRQED